MKNTSRVWSIGVAFVLAANCYSQAGVNDVKVTTDRSIDCSSIRSIARDL